jgi:hypothetical protein
MNRNFKISSVIVQCDKQYCPSTVYVVYKRQWLFSWPLVGIFKDRCFAEEFVYSQIINMKVKK